MKKVYIGLGLIFLMFLTSFSTSFGFELFNKNNRSINAGGYTLECGKYIGFETDYDHINQKTFTKEIQAELGKNKITINGITTKFSIKDNKLYVDKRVMYEIISNNKLLMVAGGGIIFEHE